MADNSDGNSTPAGLEGTPTPSAPQGESQPLDVVIQNLQSQVNTLTKKFEQGIQKENAKANSRLENKINSISSQIGRILELQGKGLSEPEIKRELFLDQLMQGEDQTSELPDGTGRQGQGGSDIRTVDNYAVADAIAEVETYGLSPNDPSFIDLLRKDLSRDKVRDYILERKKPQPIASPATVVQAPAQQNARGEKSPAQLEAEYQKEAQTILQTRTGDERVRAISQLKAKYRELGLAKI